MKNILNGLIVFAVLFWALPVSGQNKLVLNDRVQIMNAAVGSTLGQRLSADSITLTDLIDNRKRCEYWFATITSDNNNLLLTLSDCEDKIAGSKNLGSIIVSANDSEKATLLYFAISEIIKNKYSSTENKANATVSAPATISNKDTIPGSHHSSRYFFSPSALNLKKGEFYYNSLYFLVHDVQYGVSDQFSIGMGTSVFGFPFYITPKISMPINERNTFAIGDLLMLGTWGAKFTGNLLYGTYTHGDYNNNLTIGAGYLAIGGGDVSDKVDALVINVAGLVKMSDHMFLITENYLSPANTTSTASYYGYNGTQYYSTQESFPRKFFMLYGLTGFRFINKVRDLRSWQFGLSYILTSRSEVPSKYSGTNWYVEKRGTSNFIAFPVVGYARKFSTK